MAQIFQISINGTDVSQYVNNDSEVDVSVCERNRDFSLIVPGFELVMKHSAPTYSEGQIVLVSTYNSSYPFFVGWIRKSKYVEALRAYSYEVEGVISKLQTSFVKASTLHSDISATSDLSKFNPSDAEGFANVQICHAVETMFYGATGKTIDLSSVKDTVLETKEPLTGQGTKALKVKHLCMDENIMYCINNEVAIASGYIESNADYQKNIWSYFDFINFFFSSIKAVGAWSRDASPQIFKVFEHLDTPFSFTNAETYKSENDKIINPNAGVNIKFKWSSVRVDFTSTTPITLGNTFENSYGPTQIIHPANLLFSWRDLRYPESDGKMYPLGSYPGTCFSVNDATYGTYMLKAKIEAANNNFTTYLREAARKIDYTQMANYNKIQINPNQGIRSKYYQEVSW